MSVNQSYRPGRLGRSGQPHRSVFQVGRSCRSDYQRGARSVTAEGVFARMCFLVSCWNRRASQRFAASFHAGVAGFHKACLPRFMLKSWASPQLKVFAAFSCRNRACSQGFVASSHVGIVGFVTALAPRFMLESFQVGIVGFVTAWR